VRGNILLGSVGNAAKEFEGEGVGIYPMKDD
jgi:hypothetical protein